MCCFSAWLFNGRRPDPGPACGSTGCECARGRAPVPHLDRTHTRRTIRTMTWQRRERQDCGQQGGCRGESNARSERALLSKRGVRKQCKYCKRVPLVCLSSSFSLRCVVLCVCVSTHSSPLCGHIRGSSPSPPLASLHTPSHLPICHTRLENCLRLSYKRPGCPLPVSHFNHPPSPLPSAVDVYTPFFGTFLLPPPVMPRQSLGTFLCPPPFIPSSLLPFSKEQRGWIYMALTPFPPTSACL